MAKHKKKAFHIFIAIILLITQMAISAPTAVFSNNNTYEYIPNRQKYAIAPGSLYCDPQFFQAYVKTDAVWAFNSITYLTDNELNYSTEKVGYNAVYNKTLESFDPVLDSLRKKGDLLVCFRVSLANNGNYRQVASLGFGDKLYYSAVFSSEFRDYGDSNGYDYERYRAGGIQIKYESSVSGVGSRMKNSALVFADATYPKIKEIYASADIDGSVTNFFNAGNTAAYIHVRFDEDIRFSDNNAASHNNIYLKLKVAPIGGVEINDANQRAKLVRLKGNTLTFRYDIPDTIKGSDLSHCITGIYGIVDDDKGGNNALNGSYPLKVLTYTGELYGHYTSSGLVEYTSRSLITDLAGNPADTYIPDSINPVYLDKVPPHVTDISISASDSKNGFIGPGCGLTLSVSFNESLFCYKNTSGAYVKAFSPEKFIATLNVKNQAGNNLEVTGSSFSEDSKVLSFNTLILPDNVTLDGTDQIIKIKSIRLEQADYNLLMPRDARGNSLTNPVVSMPEPKDMFKPDFNKPVIETDFSITDGKFTPAVYDSDDDTKNDSFYFSFGLSDTGSGVRPIGSEKLPRGIFKWNLNELNNAAIDISKLKFIYTFTYGTEEPSENQVWNEANFGREYSFTQIDRVFGTADNIYLHIKTEGLDAIDLDESIFTITACDLVGNTDMKEFTINGAELNSILDHTPPDIKANRLYTYKDPDDGKWKFAADFIFSDKSMVNIENILSQWVDKGASPVDGNWSQIQGPESNAKTVGATVKFTLQDNVMNSKDLYVKATDCSIFVNEGMAGPYTFERDLAMPVFKAEYSGDMTTKASLIVNADAQSLTDEGSEIPAIMLVTVGNSYKSIDLSTQVINKDIFDGSGGWKYTANGADSNDSTLLSVLESTYYGEIDVRIDIGYGIDYSGGAIQNPYDSATENYTFYTAPGLNPVHEVIISSSVSGPPEGWSSPLEGAKYYTDLAGAAFDVSVKNVRVEKWKSKDIDFGNSFFAIYREENDECVFTVPINGMVSKIIIPENLNLSDGSYYAKATVTAKTSGHADYSNIISFQIDKTEPGEFGLARTETLWHPVGDPVDPILETLFEKIGTNDVFYGYDQVYNSEALAYENLPIIFLGSADNGLANPERKLYFTTKLDDEFFIKVWNATEGVDEEQSKANALWKNITTTADSTAGAGFSALITDDIDEITASYSEGVIPVVNNMKNIIKYQICHANGIESNEKVLIADVSDEAPQLEVSLTPESQLSKEVMAKVTGLYSPSDINLKVFYWTGDGHESPVDADTEADENGNILLTQEDNNWFFTSNIYQNYTILNRQAANLDADGPELSATTFWQDGDMYRFVITIKDKNNWKLFMKFDDTYMTRLGLSDYFTLEIPEPEAIWIADSPRPDGIYRIARTDSIDGTVNLDVTGVYLYDDDGGNPPESADVAYSLLARDEVGNETIYESEASSVKNARLELTLSETEVIENIPYYYYNSNNDVPVIDEERPMSLYSMRASFNLPVKNVTPLQYHRAENSYGLIKDFLNIFRDGTYTVTYEDIFGRSYQEEKTVNVENDMNISMSGLNQENKFSLSVEPVANEGKEFLLSNEGKAFTIFESAYEASLFYGGFARVLNARRTVLEFEQNETAIIAMMIYRPAWGGWFLDDNAPIILIDGSTRQAPSAEVHWYFHEFASGTLPDGETETDDYVDVWITSGTPITGVNGKLLSHRFTLGGAESYTFEYVNSEGITGSTTVTLPVSIVEEKEQQNDGQYIKDDSLGINEDDLYQKPPDTAPPEAIFRIFGKNGISMLDKGIWYSGSNDDFGDLFTWAGGFVVKIADIIDDSKTKIMLLKGINPDISEITYENTQNEEIQGAELSGFDIKITAEVTDTGSNPEAALVTYPEAFTLLIIDEENNKTLIPFPDTLWTQLDVLAPWISDLSYEEIGYAKVEASFRLKDDKTADDKIKLLSPLSLTYDSATNFYTMTFEDNREVQTVMRDLAGNVGTGTVKVDNLDVYQPLVTSVWYSKGRIGSNGAYDSSLLTNEKTNQTITAKLFFNKPVKNVELTDVYGNNYDNLPPGADHADYVTMSWDSGSATLNFLQNACASISFEALNGKTNDYDIIVFDVIDKDVPVITVDKTDNITDTFATVTFTNPGDTGEPVYVSGPGETGGRLFEPGEVITKTFLSKGTYIFRFTDEAGNTCTKNIKIENIDEYPPGILLADLPPDGTYYNDSATFKATMSEAGTLSFDGVSVDVMAPDDINGNNDGEIQDNECDWHTFTVTRNGNFPITVVDAAGRKTTAYVAIKCFDRTPPVISFKPTTITVMSDTDSAAFLALLEQGVTVTDNSTAAEEIILNHDDINAVNLSIPGHYQVNFSATDNAGNTAFAKRYVKVLSANDLNVTVNGIRTESMGTAVLNDQQVTLEVSKLLLGDNEPFKVYLRMGIWTQGQMKETEPLTENGSFTLPERDSFYTLYIVSLNRGTYLTYLYLQQ